MSSANDKAESEVSSVASSAATTTAASALLAAAAAGAELPARNSRSSSSSPPPRANETSNSASAARRGRSHRSSGLMGKVREALGRRTRPSSSSASSSTGVRGPPYTTPSSAAAAAAAIAAASSAGKNHQHRPDPYGEALAHVLRRHPAWNGGATGSRRRGKFSHEEAAADPFVEATRHPSSASTFRFPVLSRHNLQVLRATIVWLLFSRRRNGGAPRNLPPFGLQLPPLNLSTAVRQLIGLVLSNASSLRFFCTCLALGALLAVSAIHAAAVVAANYVVVGVLLSVGTSLLVDVDDLPAPIHAAARRARDALRGIDRHVLGGKRWERREWNRDGRNVSGTECDGDGGDSSDYSDEQRSRRSLTSPPPPPRPDTSLAKSLWELPPPDIKRGRRLCLSSRHLREAHADEWGDDTVKHRLAVNYCYVMIREDHLQTQAERHKRSQDRRMGRHQPKQEVVNESDENDNHHHHDDQLLVRRSYSEGGYDVVLNHAQSASSAVNRRMDSGVSSTSESYKRQARSGSAGPTLRLERINDPSDEGGDDADGKELGEASSDIINKAGASNRGAGVDLAEWMRQNRPGSPDCVSEQESSVASDCGDMPWIDVTAQIGMRLLNSAHVHRAMTDPAIKSKLAMQGGEPESTNDQDIVSPDPPHRSDPPGTITPLDLSQNRAPPTLKVVKPVHSMWTSPSAAASAAAMESPTSTDPHPPGEGEDEAFGTSTFAGRIANRPLQSATTSRQSHGLPAARRERLEPPCRELQAHASDSIEVQLQPPNSSYTTTLSRPALRHLDGRASPTNTTISSQTVTVRSTVSNQRQPLLPGVKVAVPIYPIQPRPNATPATNKFRGTRAPPCFQMGTVVRSRRILVGTSDGVDMEANRLPNCLSVTVKLDKSFLRNAEFAELTFRVMDEWTSSRCMPRHSKVPIGSCVATTFGLGVVVGWRVHDDCHVVRSLWHRRGEGSAHAYLQASAIHSVVEAAVGFEVNTKYGRGVTLAYVDGGPSFESGRFLVHIKEDGRNQGRVLEVSRKDVYTCLGAQFMPVIEHIREAARYKIQMDNYEAALREQQYDDSQETDDERLWNTWSSCLDILWGSFLKAVDEDSAFDEGVNEFMTSIIDFLERLDATEPDGNGMDPTHKLAASDFEVECYVSDVSGDDPFAKPKEKEAPGLWVINDIFGGIFRPHQDEEHDPTPAPETKNVDERGKPSHYDRIFAVLRTIMKTVSFAKAESVDHPHFRLALAISHDFLLFVRTIVKVQQKNSSSHSLAVWRRAFGEIALTFGPMKDRLERIGRGIATRMEKHGRRAKTRVLRFVDTVLGDEKLLFAMEQGEWDQCVSRLEIALIKSKIIQEQSLFYYRKTGQFIYEHVKASISNGGGAASRNNEKLAMLAQALRSIASPLRSLLKIFVQPSVLDLFERILVRVYCREEHASRILSIHASNFHSLRHLRMLKDFSVAGRIWIPLLNAADEEFSSVVAQLPENSKEFMCPLSNLFSLCVAQFHKINAGDLSKDWLDFLLEDDAVRIIDDIDMKLILSLEQFSRDIREMMEVLPYYPSIDDDILKLMDEVNLDEFLKEASAAIDDQDSLAQFFREKVTIAIERFLNYLPRMSIPVERRELGDGWVLTCRGEDGSDLTLSDVKVKRENLVCQIMGGDTLFFPMFGEGDGNDVAMWEDFSPPPPTLCETAASHEEESILDHIRSLLLQAQSYGCWKSGVGGVGEPPTDRYVASVLQGLPVSTVLNCAIELWRNLEIDDDELLEIAIRDVSFQIQLQKAREERDCSEMSSAASVSSSMSLPPAKTPAWSGSNMRPRFNPRLDPTVLFLEMKNLTLNLDNFTFRIEKSKKRTILDPIFDGRCMVSLQNINIRIRVECAKERGKRSKAGSEMSARTLIVKSWDGAAPHELVVSLENLQLRVKDTGFGSDWLLNRAVHVFGDNITRVVEENLRDQILEQCRSAVDHLNGYFLVNPSLLLNLLGVSMDDLEEHVVYV